MDFTTTNLEINVYRSEDGVRWVEVVLEHNFVVLVSRRPSAFMLNELQSGHLVLKVSQLGQKSRMLSIGP